MLEDVVVAWDGSARSRQALEWAVRRPSTRHVRLVRVLGDDGADGSIDVGPRLLLDHAVDRLSARRPDIVVEGDVLHGDVEEALVLLAEPRGILVLGTGGDAAFRLPARSRMLGRVAARAVGPVALVPTRSLVPEGPVVVGLDGTEAGVAASQIAAAEAQSTGTAVITVHVRARDGAPADQPGGPLDDSEHDLAEHFPHLLVRQRMVDGGVHAELRRSAESASLLVLGRHEHGVVGTTVIEDALTGSTTVPLLLVREADMLWPSRAGVAMLRATRY